MKSVWSKCPVATEEESCKGDPMTSDCDGDAVAKNEMSQDSASLKINTAPNVATQLMVEGAVLNPNAASWKSPAPSADIAFAPGRAVNGDWPDPEPLPYSEVYSGSNGEEGEATFGASTEVEPVLPPEPLTPTSPTPQDEHIPEGKPYVVMESASGDGEAPEAEDGLQVPVVNGAGKEPPSLVGENPTCPLTGDVGQSETQTMKPEELKEILRKQLEYYFSRENLANDMYLVSQMDSDHYVPIWTIANFNQVKRLTADTDLIVEVLKSSPLVQVDEKGEKVRPNHKRCIVILREVPESTPIEEVESLFKSENCPRFVSCEFAHNDSWYVTFESDADAQQAYKYLREEAKTFLGKPIMARIKAKSMGITAFIPKNGQQPLEVGGFHQQQFQPAAVYMQPVHYSPAQQQQQQQPPYPFYSMLSQPWSSSLGYYDGTQLVTGTFPSTAFLSSFPATGHYKHMQALQHRPYTGRSRGGGKSQGRSHHSQHDKVIPDAVSFVPMNSVHLVDRPATNGAPRGGANAGQRRPTGSTVGSGVGGGSSSSSSITSGVSGGGSSYRPHAPEQPFLGSRTQPSDVPFVRRDVEVNGGDPALLASRGRKGFRGRRRRDDERTVKCPQPPVPLVPPESPRLELAASEFPPLPGASTSVREDSVPTRHENRLADVVRGIGKASQTGSTNGSTAVPPSALNKSKPTPMPVCSPEPTIPCPTPQATVSSTTETAGTCTDEPSESRAPAPTVTPGPAEVHATEPKKLSYAQICQRPPMPPTSQPVANGSAVAGTAGDMGDADRDTADDSREPEVASKPVEGPPRDQRKQFGISTHAHAVARKPLGVQNGMARPRAAMVAKETQ
ncbi:la-related protein 4-like isoform X3 [Lethenteron reissneri]|uniref:la-related protein 4-like isoform X3 n=2 Tax=Lethenteron reissneri TaxID=7753 RepID=UPI002AB64E40|nr:la-related protein 4-like isoform X3 [Lethenteron reissneri]